MISTDSHRRPFDPPSSEVMDFLNRLKLKEESLLSAIAKLERLAEFLESENRKYNLTRLNNPSDFWSKHVADSMALALFFPELVQREITMADVGCGAGFPLFPLACFFPGLHIVGLEATQKKVEFIKEAVSLLQLDNVEVVHQQAREAARSEPFQQSFDVVTARAVGTSAKLLAHTRSLLKQGPEQGRIILYKTPKALAEERVELERECAKRCFRWQATNALALPEGGGERLLVEIRSGF